MTYESVLVSACLLGVSCRYDGSHAWCPEVFDELWRSHFIPVCPEQLGGLGTPRPPAVLDGGGGADVLEGKARVLTGEGEDVTPAFLKGAEEVLRLARLAKAKKAILKDRRPPGEERHPGFFGGRGPSDSLGGNGQGLMVS
jgi:uncharacterized protein YbbK (DUF523 family)